jgi:hypothetical protein
MQVLFLAGAIKMTGTGNFLMRAGLVNEGQKETKALY